MTSATAKPHQRPRPPLSPLRLDSISELPENSPYMNLGAETPCSILKPSLTPPSAVTVDEWAKSGLAVNTNVPARRRSWRSNSWSCRPKGMAKFQKEGVDTDCGICFEPAINPRKVLCCRQCFCLDHLMDWLSSNKNCPACNAKCSPPVSPSSSTTRLPITPPGSPPPPLTLSLKSCPTPPPTATAISFEGYQIQSITTFEHDPPARSFSPLSSSIIGIVSGHTPVLPAALGVAVGDFLMCSALVLFMSVLVPSVL